MVTNSSNASVENVAKQNLLADVNQQGKSKFTIKLTACVYRYVPLEVCHGL